MQPGFALRAARSALHDPRESFERLQGRIDAHKDRQRIDANGGPRQLYPTVDDPLRALHDAIGAPWPCAVSASFAGVWDELIAELVSLRVRVGLASYRGWNDGDRAMSGAAWCAVQHLRPATVVETGVAHGVTSRVVLDAMQRVGRGQLFSIDLPAVDPALHREIGIAVPDRLKGRWTYVAGTSRERLPELLRRNGEPGVFIHDSLLTGRNTRFELSTIWPVLRPGGVVIVDDVHRSLGFHDFVARARPEASFAADHLLGSGMWGAAVKPGTHYDGREATSPANRVHA